MGKTGALCKSNPKKPKRDATILLARQAGKTYSEIAKQFNINKSTAWHAINDPEIKDVIDTTNRYLVSFLPIVVDNYHTLLLSEDENIKLKACDAIAKITGIAPSHTSTQFIQNIFNTINVGELDPAVKNLLTMHTGAPARAFTVPEDEDVIDV